MLRVLIVAAAASLTLFAVRAAEPSKWSSDLQKGSPQPSKITDALRDSNTQSQSQNPQSQKPIPSQNNQKPQGGFTSGPSPADLQSPAQQALERGRPPAPGRDRFSEELRRDLRKETRENLGLLTRDQLNAGQARASNPFEKFRNRSGAGASRETDDLVGQLRNLTGKRNEERMSSRMRGYGAGLRPDPGSLPEISPASDEPNGGLGRRTSHVRHADGSTTTTYTRSDGSTTTVDRAPRQRGEREGQVISTTERRRDENGREITTTRTGNQTVVEVTGNGHTVRVEAYDDLARGSTEYRTFIDGRASHSHRERDGGYLGWAGAFAHALRLHDELMRRTARNVDPDAPRGKGSPIDEDPRTPDNIVHGSDARQRKGPGGRPQDDAPGGPMVRLDLGDGLVTQPDPAREAAGKGSPGYSNRGYVPSDFVRPPRPNDP